MNILIVGNGFDLSHYLPTKYDHFMDVIGAIETHEGETMSFDELFSKCREDWFIVKTKEYYLTENLSLEKDQLTEIKKLLKENSWYQYFKDHVNEVKTWIDFEQKIEQVLIVSGRCIADIANIYNSEDLTDEIDRNVRVTVYYFDRSAKFSLLNNLLAILGKEKVEHWMKNKWLQFKQNPEIKFQTGERAEFGEVS